MSEGQPVASKEREAAVLLMELILYTEHNCEMIFVCSGKPCVGPEYPCDDQ